MPPVSKTSPLGLRSHSPGPLAHVPPESSGPDTSKQGRQPVLRLRGFRRTEDALLRCAWLGGGAEVSAPRHGVRCTGRGHGTPPGSRTGEHTREDCSGPPRRQGEFQWSPKQTVVAKRPQGPQAKQTVRPPSASKH